MSTWSEPNPEQHEDRLLAFQQDDIIQELQRQTNKAIKRSAVEHPMAESKSIGLAIPEDRCVVIGHRMLREEAFAVAFLHRIWAQEDWSPMFAVQAEAYARLYRMARHAYDVCDCEARA